MLSNLFPDFLFSLLPFSSHFMKIMLLYYDKITSLLFPSLYLPLQSGAASLFPLSPGSRTREPETDTTARCSGSTCQETANDRAVS